MINDTTRLNIGYLPFALLGVFFPHHLWVRSQGIVWREVPTPGAA